jgi:hypothetical protein
MSTKASREDIAAGLTRWPYHQRLALELSGLDGEWLEIRVPGARSPSPRAAEGRPAPAEGRAEVAGAEARGPRNVPSTC